MIPDAKVQSTDSDLLLLPIENACEIALLCGPLGFRALAATCRHFRWMLNDLFMQIKAMDRFAIKHTERNSITGHDDVFVVETHRLPSGLRHGRESWYLEGVLRAYRSYRAGQFHGAFQSLFHRHYISGLFDCGQKIGTWEERFIIGGRDVSLDQAPTAGQLTKRSHYNDTEDVVVETYIRDYLYERVHLVNGLRSGICEHFHPNGALEVRRGYVDGELDGPAEWWSKDGVLTGTCTYVNGRIHGCSESRKADGTLESQRNYVHGSEEGEQRFYGLGGELRKMYTCVAGKRAGYSLRLSFIDGSVIKRSFYVQGLKNGTVQKWRESDGALESEKNYDHGLQHGDERRWDGHALTYHMESWTNGRRHGQERYYRNGKLEVTRIWIKGCRIRTIWHTENYLSFREDNLDVLNGNGLLNENDPGWFGLPEP